MHLLISSSWPFCVAALLYRNGTSMISLVIKPKDEVTRINKMLADEFGTASNIKSRVNRLSVLSAITSTQQSEHLALLLGRCYCCWVCGCCGDAGDRCRESVRSRDWKSVFRDVSASQDSSSITEHPPMGWSFIAGRLLRTMGRRRRSTLTSSLSSRSTRLFTSVTTNSTSR